MCYLDDDIVGGANDAEYLSTLARVLEWLSLQQTKKGGTTTEVRDSVGVQDAMQA